MKRGALFRHRLDHSLHCGVCRGELSHPVDEGERGVRGAVEGGREERLAGSKWDGGRAKRVSGPVSDHCRRL